MIVCLDTNIVIYLIEADPAWYAKTAARLAAFNAAGDLVAVCDPAILECLLKPLKAGDSATEADFHAFFADPLVRAAHFPRDLGAGRPTGGRV
jgi:predicted nucleic acid-binding protein